MQEWEYKSIHIFANWNNHRLLMKNSSGLERRVWDQTQTFQEYLSELGEEGWELVAAQTEAQYIFKRPLP